MDKNKVVINVINISTSVISVLFGKISILNMQHIKAHIPTTLVLKSSKFLECFRDI